MHSNCRSANITTLRAHSASPLMDLLEQSSRASASAQEEAILTASLDVFVRDGFAANMDAVAAAAGLAHRTMINHFPSKDALFEAWLQRSTTSELPKLSLATLGVIHADG